MSIKGNAQKELEIVKQRLKDEISAREKTEKELEETKKLLEEKTLQAGLLQKTTILNEAYAKSFPDVLAITDIDGNIEYFSPSAYNLFGYEEGSILPEMKIISFIDPEQWQTVNDNFNSLLHGRLPIVSEFVGIKADGTRFFMEVNGRIKQDKNGKPDRLIFVIRDISQRKNLESETRKKEYQYTEARKMAKIGHWEFDIASGFLTLSDEIYTIYEVEPDLFHNDYPTFLSFVYPDERKKVDRIFRESIKDNIPSNITHRLLLKNGSVKYINHNWVTEFSPDGKAVSLLGISMDLTEKYISEKALIKSENKYRSLFEIMTKGVIYYNIAKNKTNINNAAADILGIIPKKERVITLMDSMFKSIKEDGSKFPPDDSPTTIAMNTGKPVLNVTMGIINQKDKNLHWIQINSFPHFEKEDLRPTGVFTLFEDITERKSQEEAINVLSLAIQQSHVMTIITDLNANIEYVNPAFENITGYSHDEVIGKNIRLIQSEKTSKEVYKELWTTLLEGKNWKGEWINKKKNGEYIWEDVSISPVRDVNGNIIKYIAIELNITKRKNAERELLELNANLEKMVKS